MSTNNLDEHDNPIAAAIDAAEHIRDPAPFAGCNPAYEIGEKNASLGISITGFIVGLPVFCDSGFRREGIRVQSVAKSV